MKLWIVTNKYLRTRKFAELEEKFMSACKKRGLEFELVFNDGGLVTTFKDDICTGKIKNDGNPVLFWDKDILLAKALEKSGHRVFNSSEAIKICDSKCETALALAGVGINTPETIISPMTYTNIGYTDFDFLREGIDILGIPLIIKEEFGSFGAQVYKAATYSEALSICKNIKGRFILQKAVTSSFGRDVRIQVVGDKCVSAMLRYSDTDFRANITNGGKMVPFTPDKAWKEAAIKTSKALKLDFAGVDLLFGKDDKPYICEINSNAHFKNIDDCTGSDVALEIIDYILCEMNICDEVHDDLQ